MLNARAIFLHFSLNIINFPIQNKHTHLQLSLDNRNFPERHNPTRTEVTDDFGYLTIDTERHTNKIRYVLPLLFLEYVAES